MTAARSDVGATTRHRARPIRIGISSCLLGEQVRFDGGHKRDAFLTETFGRFVEWVPVCPEVECGLGTPREAMRLVRVEDGVRLLTVKTGIDLTRRMERYSRTRVSALAPKNLSGYVLKKDSPSCGLERVKVYDRHGSPPAAAAGCSPRRSSSVSRTCRSRRKVVWPIRGCARTSSSGCSRTGGCAACSTGAGTRRLVRFHTAHKLILMAHSPEAYRRLGRLVAGARGVSRGPGAALHRRVHDRARGDRDAAAAHERAAAHGRLLQGSARRGVEGASCWPRSTTTAASWCRSSCR